MEHQAVFPDRVDEFPDEFKCCVCLDIVYKPVVLACGHISCFWCTFKAMDSFLESWCRVCRHPYNHLPRSCELLHFMLLKLYPTAYRRRAAQVAEEEKKVGFESQQFESNFAVSGSSEVDLAQDATSKVDEQSIQDSSNNTSIKLTSSLEAPSNEANAMETSTTTKVLVTDLECAVCKQLLYRPIVLNCGHGNYCESCIHPDESVYKCTVCQIAQPEGIPSVCLLLHHFLEGYFPKEYSARKECLDHCQSEGSTEKKEQTAKSPSPSRPSAPRANIHPGVGCDYCGMYPIIGQRYSCKDCVEIVGFDLCENCHKSSSKLPGRFNQQHTEEHQFKLIPASHLRMMLSSLGAEISEDEETGSENDGVA